MLLIAVAYYLSGRGGLLLSSYADQVTLLWPPTGIALFALLAWGQRMWPAIWLAALLVNLHQDSPLLPALVIASGNTLGPVIAALALRRLGFDRGFRRSRDVLIYAGIGAVAAMAINATVGAVTLASAGIVAAAIAPHVWLTWWAGDALGALVVGPALLTLQAPAAIRPRAPGLNGELAAAWGSILLLGLVSLTPLSPFAQGLPPLLSLPLITWLALRHGVGAATWSALLLSAGAVWGVIGHVGPFVDAQGAPLLPMLWAYIFALGTIGLLVTALRSESNQALADTRDSEERLKRAERLARLGHWELDHATQHLYWSEEIFRIFEIDPLRFAASYQGFLAAIHPDDRERVNRAFAESVEHHAPYVIVHRLCMADGRIKHVEEHGHTVYAADGTPLRSLGTVQDISEREELHVELERHRHHLEEMVTQRTAELARAKEAAETANRAKSAFLANMSHELRTPLNAILGFAQIMVRDHRIPEDQRRNLMTINRSGSHLLALINDVLEISRIEAGRTEVENAPFDLPAAITAVEEMIRVRAAAKGLAFTVECGDLPSHVLGDAHHLRQVLLNLLGNAVKYTDRGHIALQVAREPEGHIRFAVTDTGPGIADEDRERIFQAFYQTADGIARGEGTGLGLTISRQFVHLMGGELTVASEPGAGTTFAFSLPLPPSTSPTETVPSRHIAGLAPGQAAPRILVAEDNPDNQRVIELLLATIGCEVRIAADGREAVDLVQAWSPQLVVMDMRMPRMDGYAATRAIRALPDGKTLPIVALTASAFEEDRGAVLAAGCDDMLRKPVEETRLFEAIGRLLGLRYAYAPPGAAVAEPPPTATCDLSRLPAAWRGELATAAVMLDKPALLAIVERMRGDFPAEAACLGRLIDDYRFEQVAELSAIP